MTHPQSGRTKHFLRISSALTLTMALHGMAAPHAAAQTFGNFGTVTSTVPNAGNAVPSFSLVDNGATVDGRLNVTLDAQDTVINWSNLNVPVDHRLHFIDSAPGLAAVLNRVTGATPTTIAGSITTQGDVQVWLINPNGIMMSNSGSFSGNSLILSTLDITNADFLDNGAMRLAGTSTSAITLGGSITATDGHFIAAGQNITAGGTISATREVALLAASDVTFSTVTGSPLGITINKGATLATAKVDATGTIQAGSVKLAGASDNGIDYLLNVASGATLTATASGGAVVLSTNGSGPDISFAAGVTSDSGLKSQGTLIANDVGDVLVSSGRTAEILGGVTANRVYDVSAATGVVLGGAGDVTQSARTNVTIRSQTGDITQGAGLLTLQSDSDANSTGGMNVVADAGNVALGNTDFISGTLADRRGPIGLVATNGSVAFRNVDADALNVIAPAGISSTGKVTTDQAITLSATNAGANVTLGSLETTANGQGITVNAAGVATVTGDVTALAGYSVTGGTGVVLGDDTTRSQAARGAITITATSGDVTQGGTGIVTLRGDTNATGSDTLSVTATSGNIALGRTNLNTGTAANFASDVLLDAATGSVAFRNVLANSLTVNAATGIVSTGNITTKQAISLSATGAGSDVTLRGLETTTAGQGITINALGTATISGNVTSLGDYSVTGRTGVVLGDDNARTQMAAGLVTITGDGGDVTQGGTGVLTLQSDSDASGGEALSISAIGSDIALSASHLIAGTLADPVSDVTLNAATGSASFGDVTANALTVNAETGIVSTGDITTRQAISLSATGAGSDVTVHGLETTTTGQGITITALGTARVNGDVTSLGDYSVSGGSVVLGNADAHTHAAAGLVTITASSGDVTQGGIGALTLQGDSDASGAQPVSITSSLGNIALSGTHLIAGTLANPLSDVALNAAAGSATFGDVTANALTVDAQDFILSTGLIKTQQAISLSATGANSDVTVNGLETTGAGAGISITALGIATVSGDVTTAGDYSVSGGSVVLGDDSAHTQKAAGLVTITASSGDVAQGGAGALTLQGDSDASGGEALSITSDNGHIALSGTHLIAGTPAALVSDVTLKAGLGSASFGDVTANALTVDAQDFILSTGLIKTQQAISLSATGANSDVTVNGLETTGAGAGISITALGIATVSGDVTTAGDYSVSGGSVVLGDDSAHTQKAAGLVTITASSGDVAQGGAGALTLQGDSDASGAQPVSITSSLGNIALSGTDLVAGTQASPVSDVVLTANAGSVTFSGVTANALSVSALNDIVSTGNILTTQAIDLIASGVGADVTVHGLETLTAGFGINIKADGIATVSGDVISLGDYSVTGGTGVVLGDNSARTQKAAGLVTITASSGNVAQGGTGILTVQGDSAATGLWPVVVTADSGNIALSNTNFIGGTLADTLSGVTLNAVSGSAAFRNVDASELTVNAETGIVSTGNIRTVQAITLKATGANADVSVNGLETRTASFGIEISASGTATVSGNVTSLGDYVVTGGNGVVLGDDSARAQKATGNVTITASSGDVSQGGTGALTLQSDSDVDGTAQPLTVTASLGDIALDTTRFVGGSIAGREDNILLTAGGQVRLNHGDGDAIVIRAGGDVTAHGNLTAGSGVRGVDPVPGLLVSSLDIATTGGDIVLNNAAVLGAGHDMRLQASGKVAANMLTAARDIQINGDLADLGALNAGRNIFVSAQTGDLIVNGANAGGVISLYTALSGDIVATNLSATQYVSVQSAGHARVGQVTSGLSDVYVYAGGEVTGIGAGAANLSAGGGSAYVYAPGLVRLGLVDADLGIDVVSGTLDITRAEAGGNLRLLANTGSLTLDTGIAFGLADVQASGDVTVSTELFGDQGVTLSSTSGNVALRQAAASNGDLIVSALSGAVTGIGAGSAKLTALSGLVDVDAGGLVQLGQVNGLTGVDVTGGSILVDQATTGGDLNLIANAGDLALTSGTATGSALLRASGGVSVTTLDAGLGATIQGATGIALDTVLVRSGDLVVTSSNGSVTGIGIGSAKLAATTGVIAVDAAGTAFLGLLNAGADINVTGGDVFVNQAVSGGALNLVANAGGLTLGMGNATGLASLQATGNIAVTTSLTAGTGVSIISSAGDIALAQVTASSGDLIISAPTGTLSGIGGSLANLTATAGTIDIEAAFLPQFGQLNAGTGIEVTSRSIEIDQAISGGFLRLDAYAGSLTLGSGQAADFADLQATGNVTVSDALSADTGVSILSSGNIAVKQVTSGGNLTLAALSGDVTGIGAGAANLSAASGLVDVQAGGLARLGQVTGGTGIDVRAGQIDMALANSSAFLTLAANAGPLTLAAGSATGFADLSASGDVIVNSFAGGTGISILSNMGDVGLDQVTVAGGDLSITALTGDVTGIGGGAAVLPATSGQISVLAGGLALLGQLDAGTGISVTGGTVIVDQAVSGGDLNLVANAGQLALNSGSAAGFASLRGSGEVMVATSLTGGTGVFILSDAGHAVLANVIASNGTLSVTASAGDVTGLGGGSADLTATAGSVVVTAQGAARLDQVNGGSGVDVTAGTMEIANAVSGGALSLTANTGALTLGNGSAAISAMLHGVGDINVTGALTAGTDLTLLSDAGDIAVNQLTATSGNLALTATAGDVTGIGGGSAALTAGLGQIVVQASGLAELGSLNANTGISVTGGTVTVAEANSGNGLGLVSTAGALTLGSGMASGFTNLQGAGDVMVTTSLTGGTGVSIRSVAGNVTLADVGTSGGNAVIAADAGDVTATGVLGSVTGMVSVSAGGLAALEAVNGRTGISVLANAITLADANTTGLLDLQASGGNIGLGTAVVNEAAITASGDIAITSLTGPGLINVQAGSGGTATIATIRSTASDVQVSGGAVDIADIAAFGQIVANAGNGHAQIGTGSAGTIANLTASGDVTVSTSLTGGTGILVTATNGHARLADLTAISGNIAIAALSGEVTGIGGAGANLTAGAGSILVEAGPLARLGTVTAGLDVNVSADQVVVDQASAGGLLTLAANAGNLTLNNGTGGTGGILLSASGSADVGTASAAGRNVTIRAADANIRGDISAATIDIVNSGNGSLRLGDNAGGTGGFELTTEEINRLNAPTLTLDSGTAIGAPQNVAIGDLALDDDSGASRLDILTTRRIDITGKIIAQSATPLRVLRFGGSAVAGDLSDVIRIAADNVEGGGRILTPTVNIEMRGRRIGAGQDAGFLNALGLGEGMNPLSASQVGSLYVGNAGSTLFNAGQEGGLPYLPDGQPLLAARTLNALVGDYMLVQNTGGPGTNAGAVLGGAATAPIESALVVSGLNPPDAGAFAIFGTINGSSDTAASLLGANIINLNALDRANTRINGCIVGSSGGGCLVSFLAQPRLSIVYPKKDDIFQTSDDFEIPFDPVVGTNNESLFGDVGTFGLDEIGLGTDLPPSAECAAPGPEVCDVSKGTN